MIEIKLSNYEHTKVICSQNNMDYDGNIKLYAAKDTNLELENELGYCIFKINDDFSQILKLHINSQDLFFIADGVLRTTVNFLLEHGVKKAIYKGNEFINLFIKLGFKEIEGLFSIDINEDIFSSCKN